MNAVTLINEMLANINILFHGIIEDLSDEEWVSRPAPGSNRVAFTAWHLPRTQDHFIQLWIRGESEVIYGERWLHWQHLRRYGSGIGITLEESDEIALSLIREDVLDYEDAVYNQSSRWLHNLIDPDLDLTPNMREYLSAYPDYLTAGYHRDTEHLLDLPAWCLLMRPCIGHVYRHLGELELAKELFRKRS